MSAVRMVDRAAAKGWRIECELSPSKYLRACRRNRRAGAATA